MTGRSINVSKVATETTDAIVSRLRVFDSLVEIGIGRRTEVAAALSAHASVTATDVTDRTVPRGVRFVRDDVTDPDPAVYAGADAVYGLNLPPELHRPARSVARTHDTYLVFTTLGTDPAAVPTRPETIPGETLFWARDRSADGPSEVRGTGTPSVRGPSGRDSAIDDPR